MLVHYLCTIYEIVLIEMTLSTAWNLQKKVMFFEPLIHRAMNYFHIFTEATLKKKDIN